jgi:hypothetical protein
MKNRKAAVRTRSPDRTAVTGRHTYSLQLAAALPSSPCLRLLRPILVEQDRDHDHRAGRNHHGADHRQFFEDSESGSPPPMVSRKAPASHTQSETSVWPPAGALTLKVGILLIFWQQQLFTLSYLKTRLNSAFRPAAPWLLRRRTARKDCTWLLRIHHRSSA